MKKEEDLVFSYANLNDDQMAEWGYISFKELKKVGAYEDKYWEPCKYRNAIAKMAMEKK